LIIKILKKSQTVFILYTQHNIKKRLKGVDMWQIKGASAPANH